MTDPLTEPLKRTFARIVEQAPTADRFPRPAVSPMPVRRGPRIALRVGLAAGLAATAVAVIQVTSGPGSRSVTGGTPESVTTQAAGTTSSVPSRTPAAADSKIVLTGRDGGLYLDDVTLPDELMLTGAREDSSGGVSSSEFGVWSTMLARYSRDRSRIDQTIRIETMRLPSDRTFRTVCCVDEGVLADADGTEVWLCSRTASWALGSWTMLASSAGEADSTEELLQVAATAVADEQGRIQLDVLPEGFEVLGTLPDRQYESGRRWTTGYVTPDSTTYDEPVVTLTVVEQPKRPAEYELAVDVRLGTAYATTVLGRRAIVAPGNTSGGLRPAVTVTWDESDGQQIRLRYVPMRRGQPFDVLATTAIDLARGIRRADAQRWQDEIATAETNMKAFVDDLERPSWMIDQLADRDLELVSMTPIPSSAPAVLIANVVDDSGADAGTCEFMLREIVACTSPQDPIWNGNRSAVVTQLDGGYMRVLTTGDVSAIHLADPTSSNLKGTTPLRDTDDEQSTSLPRVAYFAAVPALTPVCLELRAGAANEALLAAYELLDTELNPPGNTCDLAMPYN